MIVRTCTPFATAGREGFRPATRFTCPGFPGPIPLSIFFEIILEPEIVGVPIPLDAFLFDDKRTQVGTSNTFVWNHRTGNSTYLSYVWDVKGIQVPAAGEYVLDVYVAARMMRSLVIYCNQLEPVK